MVIVGSLPGRGRSSNATIGPSTAALDTSLHGLMMDSKRLAHREKRWLFPIAQQYPCPLHPTRRFRSRLRYRPQVLDVRISKRHFNRPPPRCHSFSSFVSRPPTADIGV